MSEENQGTKKMVEIILAAVVGIGLGIGGTVIVINQPQQDQTDEVAEAQQEVIKQLTDLDLIKEICAPEQTKTKEGFLLCREMTCFVYSRGIDSQTSGKQCEEISNISNTISMIEYCKEHTDSGSICYEIFYRRK